METILPTEKKPYAWPDGTMGVIRIGTDFRFFGAAAGFPRRTAGTLDDPTALEVQNLKIENLGKPYHYAAGGPVYEDAAQERYSCSIMRNFTPSRRDIFHSTAS